MNVETEEMLNAERLWVKSLQNVFHDDPSYDQLKNQLGVVLTEEENLHCRGRLQHSKLPYSQTFPALLPSDSYVTELIIQQCHERVFHNKTRETLNELWSRYWITRARQKVQIISYKCVMCHTFEGEPYVTPVMVPLPRFRLDSEVPAFQTVGLDYCGPIYLKSTSENPVIKAWICLFSCKYFMWYSSRTCARSYNRSFHSCIMTFFWKTWHSLTHCERQCQNIQSHTLLFCHCYSSRKKYKT